MENDDFIKLITDYLETVLEESFKYRKSSKNLDDDEQNHVENLKRSGQRKYIANVSVCKGVPIYGFQLGYRFLQNIFVIATLQIQIGKTLSGKHNFII